VSTFIPTFLEISHPSLHNKVSKTTATNFLLKKNINPTPYRISEKREQPLHTPHASIFFMKLLKALNNLTTLK
jgi:hypothetical protein